MESFREIRINPPSVTALPWHVLVSHVLQTMDDNGMVSFTISAAIQSQMETSA